MKKNIIPFAVGLCKAIGADGEQIGWVAEGRQHISHLLHIDMHLVPTIPWVEIPRSEITNFRVNLTTML